MSTIFIDPTDGMLSVKDSYADKERCSSAGCYWDSENKLWKMIFTLSTLDTLLSKIPHAMVDPSMKKAIEEQKKKEDALVAIKKMSDENQDISMRLDDISAPLFPYQKLGVLYAITNGKGVLIGDQMGLGKTIQGLTAALVMKNKGLIQDCLIVTPASLKYNWPLEVEKFTKEKCIVIDGKKPEDRIAKWLDKSAFFKIANYELIVEDLFGGRAYKEKENETKEDVQKRLARKMKQSAKASILADIKNHQWGMLVVDECFPYETLISTNHGQIPIGEIVENQLPICVWSKDISTDYPSLRKIVKFIKKPLIKTLVEVKHERGSFICTEDHKIWTKEYGYIKARELCEEGRNSSLLTLSEGIFEKAKRKENTDVLFKDLCGSALQIKSFQKISEGGFCKNLRILWKRISRAFAESKQIEILFKKMFRPEQDYYGRREDFSFSCAENGRDKKYGEQKREAPRAIRKDEKIKSRPGFSAEGYRWLEKVVERTSNMVSAKGRTRAINRTTENTSLRVGRRVGNGICNLWEKIVSRGYRKPPMSLCNRYRQSKFKNSDRGGWGITFNEKGEMGRCEKGKGIETSRVETVTFLEQGDYDRLGICHEKDKYVYDLEVEEHHNYFANNVLVSNCHMLKHTTSKRYKAIKAIKAGTKIFLSGTPMDGRLEELYSIMGILAPGLLGSRPHFFSRYVVTDFFGGIKGYKNINEVQKIIQPFFLRRLKKDVLKQLPEKTYENKVIELTPEERKIYDAIKKGKHPCVQKDGLPVEPMVRAIRCMQFVNFPQMIEPTCKSTTKMDILKDVIIEMVQLNGQKAIIFTQYKQLLNVVDGILKELKLKFLRIDGDTDKQLRADYQNIFNTDTSIDCIIGTDAMSTGLNLIGGDLVLSLTQSWQPAIMAQREDRAYRIGRKDNVLVMNMLCKDTIEEKMRKVLYAKDKLTAETLGDDTDEAVLKRLGPKEIEDLL